MLLGAVMRNLASFLLLASLLPAQVPVDAVLVLDASPVAQPNFHLVDARGRGASLVLGQSVFMNFVSVATDPVDASHVYYETSAQGFAGTWEAKMPLCAFATNSWGSLGRTAAARIEVGASEVYGLENDALFAVPKSGGTRRVLRVVQNAADLAVAGPFLFVAAYSPLGAPLVRYDLTTQTAVTLTTLGSMRAVAWSAATNEVVVATELGTLLRIDPANGTLRSTKTVSSLPVLAVVVASSGSACFSDGTAVYSEVAPNAALFVAPAPILDLAIGAAPTAAVLRFGSGCALDPQWAFTGLPSLGNLGFGVGVRGATPNGVAFLALGGSRLFSSVLGAPLPIDLTTLNMPGCELAVDPLLVIGLGLDGTGGANLALPIPNQPALRGEEAVAEWIVSAPGANGLGLAVGAGAALRLW